MAPADIASCGLALAGDAPASIVSVPDASIVCAAVGIAPAVLSRIGASSRNSVSFLGMSVWRVEDSRSVDGVDSFLCDVSFPLHIGPTVSRTYLYSDKV